MTSCGGSEKQKQFGLGGSKRLKPLKQRYLIQVQDSNLVDDRVGKVRREHTEAV